MNFFLKSQFYGQWHREAKKFTFTFAMVELQRCSRKLQYATMKMIPIIAEESNI